MSDRMTPHGRRIPRAVAAALAIAASVALAGCVGIPSNGGVNVGPAVGSGSDQSFSELVQGPQTGATKDELLSDFMQAVVSPENDYGVARQFLTQSAAQSWDPTKSVLIREGGPNTSAGPGDSIDYTVTTRASISDSGIYSEQNGTSSQSLSFAFKKVAGQWRISGLADGIVVSRTSFNQFFTAQTLYFFDPTFRYLVPDLRWFPTGSGALTRTVSALLAGPSAPLQGGVVVSAFPQGVKQQKAVEVRSSTATVDLSADAATVKPLVQSQMLTQLQESLSSQAITDVSIVVGGAPLQVARASADVATAVDPAPLVLKGKKFGFWPRLTAIGKLSARIAELDPTSVTVARSQGSAAVLAKSGVYLVTDSGTAARLVDTRPRLIAPSIDPFGFVWSVPSTDPSAIRVTGTDGVQHSITSTLPSHSTIVSLQVSHDGTRALLYLKTSSGPRLVVVGVLRRTGNVPTSLGMPLDLPVSSANPVDATWVDSGSVAALGVTNGRSTVVSYTIGGTAGDASTQAGAVHIVGGSGDLRLLASDGDVYQLRSSGWQELGFSASVLATQQ